MLIIPWFWVAQCLALLAVIELFVRCMPAALRRASLQNCYRVDGTRSEHRTYREWRAKNRLRRDMLAVLVLVFLTGNALYFTIDSVVPFASIFEKLSHWLFGTAVADNNDFDRNRLWILGIAAIWAVMCFCFVSWGALRAYRSFAEGVNARSAEHFHLDMTRMSVTEAEAINLRQQDSQGADVA